MSRYNRRDLPLAVLHILGSLVNRDPLARPPASEVLREVEGANLTVSHRPILAAKHIECCVQPLNESGAALVPTKRSLYQESDGRTWNSVRVNFLIFSDSELRLTVELIHRADLRCHPCKLAWCAPLMQLHS